MKYLCEALITISIIVFAIGLMFLIAGHDLIAQKRDCQLSEISPDFSPDMRELCRKLRAVK